MNCSGVIIIARSGVHGKYRGQRSMSQRSKQILPQFEGFRTVTFVRIHGWLQNDAQRLDWCRRCVLMFFKVIHRIFRSHGPKNQRFWQKKSAFPDWNSFDSQITTKCSTKLGVVYKKVPYCFSRSSVKFQDHTDQKFEDFSQIESFQTVTPV